MEVLRLVIPSMVVLSKLMDNYSNHSLKVSHPENGSVPSLGVDEKVVLYGGFENVFTLKMQGP